MPAQTSKNVFKHTQHLSSHRDLLGKILEFFQPVAGVDGAFVSGSLVSGGMDEYSDLDLGFLVSDTKVRDRIWKCRWDWQIAPWFHRFDADHIKPYFIIYFF